MMDAVAELRPIDAKHFVMHLRRPFAFVIEALGRSGHQVPVMMPARLARLDAAKPVPEVVGSGPFISKKRNGVRVTWPASSPIDATVPVPRSRTGLPAARS